MKWEELMPGPRGWWCLIGCMIGAAVILNLQNAAREDQNEKKSTDHIYRQWCLVSAELRKMRGEPESPGPYIVLERVP